MHSHELKYYLCSMLDCQYRIQINCNVCDLCAISYRHTNDFYSILHLNHGYRGKTCSEIIMNHALE